MKIVAYQKPAFYKGMDSFFTRYKAVSGRRKQFWAVSFDLNKIFYLYPFLGQLHYRGLGKCVDFSVKR